MKAIDFFCLNTSKNKAILGGLLCCFALVANAEPVSPEAFEQSKELILTLSDSWLEADATQHSRFQKTNLRKNMRLIIQETKTRPANIGCAMEPSPVVSMDSSLTSRVVGKCNFNYQY